MLSENVMHHINPNDCEIKFELQGELQLRGKNSKLNVFSATDQQPNQLLA